MGLIGLSGITQLCEHGRPVSPPCDKCIATAVLAQVPTVITEAPPAITDAPTIDVAYPMNDGSDRKQVITEPAPTVPTAEVHPAADYLRRLFLPNDRVLIQLIHATETYIKIGDIFYTSRDTENERTYTAKDGKQIRVRFTKVQADGKERTKVEYCRTGETVWNESKNVPHSSTLEMPRSLESACEAATIKSLTQYNADGWHIYITMNPILPASRRRTKGDIADIRSVYIEIDENGDAELLAINAAVAAGEIPQPNTIMSSSPGKYHVIWFVTGFNRETQEATCRALQRRFHGDEASTDVARVLRLPAFRNVKPKYADKPVVPIQNFHDERSEPSAFKLPVQVAERSEIGVEDSEKVKNRIAKMDEHFALAGIETVFQKTGKKDWIYQWETDCPRWEEHEGDTVGAVGIARDGTMGFHCFHGHGDIRWTQYKEYLEAEAGAPLVFGDDARDRSKDVLFGGVAGGSVAKESGQVETATTAAATSEPAGRTAFVFETADEVDFMRKLGLAGCEQTTQSVDVLRSYERVLLFGVTAETKKLQAAIGAGASLFPLPANEAAIPETRYGRKVYPRFQTMADAIRYFDNDFGGREELLLYFMTLLGMESVRQLSTRAKATPQPSAAPTEKPKTTPATDFEDDDIPEVAEDGTLDTRIYEERSYKSVAYPEPGDNDLVTLAAKALVHGTNIPLAYAREPLKAAVLHCLSDKLIHPMYPKLSTRGYYVSCGESDSGKTTGLDFVLDAFRAELAKREVYIDSLFTYRSESMFVQMLSEKGTLKSTGRGKEKMTTGEAGHPNQFLHIKEGNQVATAGEYFTAIAGQLSNLYDQTTAKAASQTNKIVTAHNVKVSAVLCFTASDFYKAFGGKGAVGGGVLTRAAILCPPEDHSRDDRDWERLPQADMDAAIHKIVKRLDWLLHQGISSPVEEPAARAIRLATKKACKAAGKYGKRVMDYFLREQVMRAVFCAADVQLNQDFVMTAADAALAQAWATAQIEARVANWPDDGGLIEGKEASIRRAVTRCHIPLGELKHACNYYKSGSGGHWAFTAALKNVLESRAVKRTGTTRKGTPTFCPGGCARHKKLDD